MQGLANIRLDGETYRSVSPVYSTAPADWD